MVRHASLRKGVHISYELLGSPEAIWNVVFTPGGRSGVDAIRGFASQVVLSSGGRIRGFAFFLFFCLALSALPSHVLILPPLFVSTHPFHGGSSPDLGSPQHG